jgi:hypothetical protein
MLRWPKVSTPNPGGDAGEPLRDGGVASSAARHRVPCVPVPAALSEDFVSAAVQQRDALQERVRKLRSEAEALRAQVEDLEARAVLDERLLQELDDVLQLAPQLRVDLQTDELRGQRLREVAIEILRTEVAAGESIHYRDWFRLVRAGGHRIAGKDPIATFLTQVSRSKAVESVGSRSGLYRLRVAA